MSQELIYTSAPQGLKPGSRGFCTVVSTQGMAVNLSERLESLSGYRHVFPPQDPKESLNPVVYSHLKLVIGGYSCHVLSRICAAGLDYTQRTNKFAHHVVLGAAELPPAGPAWLLAQPGFMATDWEGQPRILPAGRCPPTGQLGAAVCKAWQEATGDAGWGGVLAQTAVSDNRAGAMVVFRPGMDVLPLVTEAIALLPPERRWDVTFSTYFTKLPPGVACHWRFLVEGTPEAAARLPGVPVIDLCRPLGRAADSVWTCAARTGEAPQLARSPVETVANRPTSRTAEQEAELERLLEDEAATVPKSRRANVESPSDSYMDLLSGLGPPPVPQASPGEAITSAISQPPEPRTFNRKTSWPLPWIIAAAAAVAIIIAGSVFVSVGARRITNGLIASAGDDSTPKGAPIAPPTSTNGNAGRPKGSPEEEKGNTPGPLGSIEGNKDSSAGVPPPPVSCATVPPTDEQDDKNKPPAPSGTDTTKQLPIEKVPDKTAAVAECGTLPYSRSPESSLGPFPITSIPSDSVTIELFGGRSEDLDGKLSIEIAQGQKTLKNGGTAEVIMKVKGYSETLKLGTFALKDRQLKFTWLDTTNPKAEWIRYCSLRLQWSPASADNAAAPNERFIALWKPIDKLPPAFLGALARLANKDMKFEPLVVAVKDLPPDAVSRMRIDNMRIGDFTVAKLPDNRNSSGTSNPSKDPFAHATFSVSKPEANCPAIRLSVYLKKETTHSLNVEFERITADMNDAIADIKDPFDAIMNHGSYADDGVAKVEELTKQIEMNKTTLGNAKTANERKPIAEKIANQEKEKAAWENARDRRKRFSDFVGQLVLLPLQFDISIDIDGKHDITLVNFVEGAKQ